MAPVTEVLVPLRWSDMDAYRHVNNVQFLRLLEEARIEAFDVWFGGDSAVLAAGILVARNEIDYLAPLDYRRAPVAVDLWVCRIGGAGFDLAYVVRDPDGIGSSRYAVAESTMVLYDFAALAPRRMTPAERAVLTGLLGDPAPMRRRR
jgi:acyl-CoA thioester hydrolase